MDVSFVRLVERAVGVLHFKDRVGVEDIDRRGLLWVHGRNEEPAPRLLVIFVNCSRRVAGKGLGNHMGAFDGR